MNIEKQTPQQLIISTTKSKSQRRREALDSMLRFLLITAIFVVLIIFSSPDPMGDMIFFIPFLILWIISPFFEKKIIVCNFDKQRQELIVSKESSFCVGESRYELDRISHARIKTETNMYEPPPGIHIFFQKGIFGSERFPLVLELDNNSYWHKWEYSDYIVEEINQFLQSNR